MHEYCKSHRQYGARCASLISLLCQALGWKDKVGAAAALLESSCVCEVDTHLAQLTIKFVSISLQVVDLMVSALSETTAHTVHGEVVSKALPFVAQLAACDRLATQLGSHALVIDNGWSFKFEDIKGALKTFSDVQAFVYSGWGKRGQKLVDSLETVLPWS